VNRAHKYPFPTHPFVITGFGWVEFPSNAVPNASAPVDTMSAAQPAPKTGEEKMAAVDFIRTLETDLQRRGVPFDRGALLAFVADAWPLIEDDPEDVQRWAGEFLAGSGAVASHLP